MGVLLVVPSWLLFSTLICIVILICLCLHEFVYLPSITTKNYISDISGLNFDCHIDRKHFGGTIHPSFLSCNFKLLNKHLKEIEGYELTIDQLLAMPRDCLLNLVNNRIIYKDTDERGIYKDTVSVRTDYMRVPCLLMAQFKEILDTVNILETDVTFDTDCGLDGDFRRGATLSKPTVAKLSKSPALYVSDSLPINNASKEHSIVDLYRRVDLYLRTQGRKPTPDLIEN